MAVVQAEVRVVVVALVRAAACGFSQLGHPPPLVNIPLVIRNHPAKLGS